MNTINAFPVKRPYPTQCTMCDTKFRKGYLANGAYVCAVCYEDAVGTSKEKVMSVPKSATHDILFLLKEAHQAYHSIKSNVEKRYQWLERYAVCQANNYIATL